LSKLLLDLRVPDKYDKATMADIIRQLCTQVNRLSEGTLSARYQAQASVPTSVAAAVGDVVWDSNVTVLGTVGSQYVRLGWICNVASQTAPTFQEIRVMTGT